jgi:prepilin-type N-terminal cleavage/methylation domain-containing protein
MRLLQKHYHGFTLIELLITTAIAAIVVGGGIAGFIGFTDRQEVLNTAKEVQQMMRTAQSKARVRDVPTVCTGKLSSYEVAITSTQATLTAICTTPLQQVLISTYKYSKALTVTGSPSLSPLTLRFTTLEQGVLKSDDTPLGATTTFTFAVPASHSFSFTVSPIGKISTVQ